MNWEFRKDLVEANFLEYESLTLTNLQFTKQDIASLEINFENLKEILFTNCKFMNTIFYNIFFTKVKFINCEFTNVTFSECNLNYVIVNNSKFTNTSFHACEANNIKIEESLIQYSKFTNTKISYSKLDGIHLRENIHQKCKYLEVEFFKCDFEKENICDTPFKKCDLRTSRFNLVTINLDDLISSRLSFMNAIELLGDKGIILED